MTDSTSTNGADEAVAPASGPMADGELPTAGAPDTQRKRSAWARRRTWVIAGAAILAAGVGVALWVSSTQPSILEAAVTSCGLASNSYVSLGDKGQTLTIDGAGDEAAGADIADMACVLTTLDASAAALAQMDGTNSLQGRQAATSDDIDASWTYHPDDGFDLILTTRRN